MDSLTGQLLIAIPELPDSNFFRSVVFMIEHSSEGAMGVILNRPSNVKLGEIWNQLDPNVNVERDDFVHLGGPVKGPIVGLHEQFQFNDNEVIDGVYMTMDSHRLNELVEESEFRFKAFSGYSGWGPNQLESEIEHGGWFVTGAKPGDVFYSSHDLWKHLCERVGQDILSEFGITKNSMIDPNLN